MRAVILLFWKRMLTGDENKWSMAFYTYSHMKYEPSFFNNGTWHGTPEEAFDTSAVYLVD